MRRQRYDILLVLMVELVLIDADAAMRDRRQSEARMKRE